MDQNRDIMTQPQAKVYIDRYSLSAAPSLQRDTPLVGHVHSCYARILNIQTPGGQLLTLQGPGLLQAPCAASLTEEIENYARLLAPGDPVVRNDQAPGALCLILAAATLWDGRLLPLANLSAATLQVAAEKLTQWLAQHVSGQGLVPVLAAFNGAAVRSPLHRRFCNALMPVLAARHVSASSMADMAAQIVGLGEGLTPSGDDLLVGFWAVLHLTGHATMLLPAPAWLAPLVANTTDLSAAFLRCALEGHFSGLMVRLLHALYSADPNAWQTPAADLARVGHSSGVDAMAGIVFANQLLASVSIISPQ